MRKVCSFILMMVIISGSVGAKPAEPIITEWEMPKLVPLGSEISIQWNTWSGEKAERWLLLQNGHTVDSGSLHTEMSDFTGNGKTQHGSIDFLPNVSGTHEYHVMLCNGEGCSLSKNSLRVSVIDRKSDTPFPEQHIQSSRESMGLRRKIK